MFCFKQKKISFDHFIEVLVIPHMDETGKLWWSDNDLQLFKESSKIEIKRLQKIHPAITIQQASKLLYQPPNMTIVYDSTNFGYE